MTYYELVGAQTYATLTRTFYAGRKYPGDQVGNLANAQAPHGGPLFSKVEDSKAEEVALSSDMVVSVGSEPASEEVVVEPVVVEPPKEEAPEPPVKKSVTFKKAATPSKPQAKKDDDDDVVVV